MYGRDMGNISAYVTVGDNDAKMWEKSGDQGNQWGKAQFNVDSKVPFSINIVAILGSSWRSDSAVDNLFLHDKPCGKLPCLVNHVVSYLV